MNSTKERKRQKHISDTKVSRFDLHARPSSFSCQSHKQATDWGYLMSWLLWMCEEGNVLFLTPFCLGQMESRKRTGKRRSLEEEGEEEEGEYPSHSI